MVQETRKGTPKGQREWAKSSGFGLFSFFPASRTGSRSGSRSGGAGGSRVAAVAMAGPSHSEGGDCSAGPRDLIQTAPRSFSSARANLLKLELI